MGESDAPGSVLVVEDEPRYRRLVTANLELAGYEVREAATGHDAVQGVYEREPDAIVLDLRLPDASGLVLCQRLRRLTLAPILVLTALDGEDVLVQALDAGADDFVAKPFSPAELVARLHALIRRSRRSTEGQVLACGDVRLDPDTRSVEAAGRRTRLTPTEWRLLREFVRHPGKLLTREHLLATVWGSEHLSEHEYLRVYIGRLRRYIEPDPRRPAYLVSYVGAGYALYPSARSVDDGATQRPAGPPGPS